MKKLILIFVLLTTTCLYSTIINIPADQPTIQVGINVAVNSDTLLVQPGTYLENINYNGKNITIASLFLTTQDTTYISQTIIDGNQNGTVVSFENGETNGAVLTGFTITNGSGGGIGCVYTSYPRLENLIITGNSGDAGGGILCMIGSSPTLENVTITGNSAHIGSGINCSLSSNPDLINVLIVGNSAVAMGGGISCYEANPSLVNVTISDNTANEGSGIYCRENSGPELIDCIFWNNSPVNIFFDIDGESNNITISYSDIQDGEAGIVTNNNGTVNWLDGNIEEDPLFTGTGEDPYSLLVDSPCIDAGIPDTTGLNLPPWDIIGNIRIWDGDGDGIAIIDMGAYEYGSPPYVDVEDNVIIQTSEVFLHQNYPNPFNPTTTISYSLKENSKVSLNIYNIKGQKVKTLVNEELTTGQHSVVWNGTDENNKTVSSGIYFYKLKTNNFEKAKKMILMK
ncbi:MAG: T9SS type A sorting domain-containing protein [Candidatus Cloacimonetes bacterium]|nr:T9SS type A sorting domain-containing protein [Candidatus Cloacimonadota bacterium]